MRKLAAHLRRRAARGPRPTRIARRPSSTRARWPRGSSATWPRPCTREAQQNEKTTQGRRQGPLRARRRGLRVLPGQLPRRGRRRRAALPARRHPLLQARQVRGGRARVPGGRQDAAGGQVPQGRAAAGDGRVREGAQAAAAAAASARSPTSDRLFGEAADLYATLFPKDKEIVTVIYKNGQFFFDYGDYDEAVKRFGLIVERYPDDPNAGAGRRPHPGGAQQGQGLREHRELGAPPQEDQGVLVEGRAGAPGQADRRRGDEVGREVRRRRQVRQGGRRSSCACPTSTRATACAPKALNNAGAVLEKAKKQDEAVAAYKELADKYPSASEAPDALFTAARIEENVAYYDKAAALYEQLGQQVPAEPARRRRAAQRRRAAPEPRPARQGHQALRRVRAGATRTSSDAKDVAFQAAVVREDQKDWRGAAAGFAAFAQDLPGRRAHRRGATRARPTRSSRRATTPRAKEAAAKALAALNGGGKHAQGERERGEDASYYAAEARYIQGELVFRDYERIKIAGKPRQLAKVLEEKAKRLEEAKAIYLDVVTYKSPEWATAGLLRIGQGYEAYAKAMRNAPVPKDLNAEEKQMYRDELEKVVVVIEDKALDAYKSGYAQGAADRRLQQAHAGDPAGAVAPGRERVPEGGRAARSRPAPASRASRSTASKRCAVISRRARRARRWRWRSLVAAPPAARTSRAGARARAANPIAPVVAPEGQRRGAGRVRRGRAPHEDGAASTTRRRASRSRARDRAGRPRCSRPGTTSACIETRARQLRQGRRRLRARARHPARRAQDAARLRREPAPRPPPQEGGARSTRSGSTPTRTTSTCAPATGRSCARRARSTSRWSRRACCSESQVRTYPTR